MLYLIGTGLSGVKSLTRESIDVIKGCAHVFIEDYTSLSSSTIAEFSGFLGKKITPADRTTVEQKAELILKDDVAILIHGDPLMATTHIDLLMRAKETGIKYRIIHNASVINAVAKTGLQAYKFGKTASIAFSHDDYMPTSHAEILRQNLSIGAHTLFLLDLKPGEDKFLTINEAIEGLLKICRQKSIEFNEETMCVGCARLGQEDERILYGCASKLRNADFDKAPYCLIVPGPLHFAEEEMLNSFRN